MSYLGSNTDPLFLSHRKPKSPGKCMIKIFGGGWQGWWHLQTPAPYEQLSSLPTQCFKMFWKDLLITPTPHHLTSSILHCYPSPSTTPSPHTNFDHILTLVDLWFKIIYDSLDAEVRCPEDSCWDIALRRFQMCWHQHLLQFLTYNISRHKSPQGSFCNNLVQVFVFFTIIQIYYDQLICFLEIQWLYLAVKSLHWILWSNPYRLLHMNIKC